MFLLKSKDETYKYFITFAKQAQRTYEAEIKSIRTDNGTEFKNYTMQEFVQDEGIKHEFSAPYTPQQNGCVEVSCDLEFLENNGSQAEQVVPCDVGDGDSSQVIKLMGVGHILPVETREDHY